MPRFEDPYVADMVASVVNRIGTFRRPPNMLCLGGGPQWRFAKVVATQGKIEKIFYADNNPKEKELADKSGLYIVQCDPANAEEMNAGNTKYDIILMKNTLEEVASRIEKLDEYLIGLYKTVKLKGLAVLISRLRPTVPLPDKVTAKWKENVPDEAALQKAVEDTGLGIECKCEKIAYDCSLTKAQYKDMIKNRELPFCDGLTDAEVKKVLDKYKTDKIQFKDEVYTITIRKRIERLKRDDTGIIVDDGVDM